MTAAHPPPEPTRRRVLTLLGLGAVAALGGCDPAPGTDPGPAAAPTAGPTTVTTGPRSTAPARSGAPHATASAPHTTAPPTGPRGGAVPARRGAAMLGAYLDIGGASEDESLALRRRQLGRDPRILHYFYAWNDLLPSAVPQLPDGAILMLTWRGTRYDTITSGSADALIARAGRQLHRYGKPVLLRWAWEMNGDWYPWGGARNDEDTAGYVAAWRRLHRIIGAQGADNVSWVWSPNWNSKPAAAWNDLRRYYPGDRYVDWVGVSGYNLGGESPQRLFGGLYAEYAARKPVMIAEVGAADRGPGTKAEWVTRFAAWVRAHPDVGAVVWFDTDTHPTAPYDWRIDTDPQALAAYRAMARDAAFAG